MVLALAGDSTTTISMNSQRVGSQNQGPKNRVKRKATGLKWPAVVAAIDGIVNPGCQTRGPPWAYRGGLRIGNCERGSIVYPFARQRHSGGAAKTPGCEPSRQSTEGASRRPQL